MSTSDKTKDFLLGMPFGTAAGRLRKLLLFSMAKKLGLTKCFRCGAEIEREEDLSIEHINSWQLSPNPIETFFDTNNVTFSHLKCNTGASPKTRKQMFEVRKPDKATAFHPSLAEKLALDKPENSGIIEEKDSEKKTIRCRGCGKYLEPELFVKNPNGKLDTYCIDCREKQILSYINRYG